MSKGVHARVDLEGRDDGTVLPVRAHAGARQNAILGSRGRALRVAVSAAPEKGKANQAIITVLSKAFGIPKSTIELIAGSTSRQKRFLLVGFSQEQAQRKLQQILPDEKL